MRTYSMRVLGVSVVVAVIVAVLAVPALAKLISGTNNDDELKGPPGADQISGYNGADTIWGKAGGDDVWGGAQTDEVYGDRGADIIDGGIGHDVLKGAPGDDHMHAADSWDGDVNCGAGYDRAYADEDGDYVADNCEQVSFDQSHRRSTNSESSA